MPQPTVYIETYGCQMNVSDSELMLGRLAAAGYSPVEKPDGADVILVNTCAIRDHAEQKVFGRMGHFRRLKENNPNLVIGIIGCMAQEHGNDFFRMNPEIDLVCGTGNLSQVPDLVEEILEGRSPKAATDRLDEEYSLDGISYRSENLKALVTIMKGCDHRCTYCIVPYTRGVERSRNSESILKEMRDLASRGFKDVMLLGQNVNSYGKGLEEDIDFAGLLEKIQSAAPEIDRIRFITSHPKDAHSRLFNAMRDLPSVCEHLHLPVQSGSDRILRRMKREHTREWYLEQIGEYRQLVTGGSLTTDLIVGFPGETESDFQDTLRLITEAQFDSVYAFTYSERPGTPAVKLENDVPEAEKSRRLQEVMRIQRAMSLKKNQELLGTAQEVLFESKTRRDEGRYVGRTRSFKRVVVSSGEDLTGKIRPAKITAVADETLLGELSVP